MARAKKIDEAAVPFEDLLEFVKAKESPSVRILKIKSNASDAPEAVRLAYSYPLVEAGDDGFETVTGEFVTYA